MAITSKNSLGSIVSDFSQLGEAFGLGTKEPSLADKGGTVEDLFDVKNFGSTQLSKDHWTGNAFPASTRGNKDLRYGFVMITPSSANPGFVGPSRSGNGGLKFNDFFFLQTAPESIQQTEVFGTNVAATRKGVIIESEGVVFKDLVIKGNTGVFPGERSGANQTAVIPTSGDSGTTEAQGVNAKTGYSRKSGVEKISGYEEFHRLRQFFMRYQKEKVDTDGQRLLGWINEKDQQYLIVEPLTFIMERNAKRPLTYDYTITLKAVASLDAITAIRDGDSSILDDIAAIANQINALAQVAVQALNTSRNALVTINGAFDAAILRPLRQLSLALNAFSSLSNNFLALPAILQRNVNDVTLAIAEAGDNIFATVKGPRQSKRDNPTITTSSSVESQSSTNEQNEIVSTGPTNVTNQNIGGDTQFPNQDNSTFNGQQADLLDENNQLTGMLTSEQYEFVVDRLEEIEDSPLTPIPRSFIEDLAANVRELSDQLADQIGLGSDEYNELQGREYSITTEAPETTTDEKIQILGNLQVISQVLNILLSDNKFYKSDINRVYEYATTRFSQVATIIQPNSVREAIIQSNDDLERIAYREYGDARRWVDLIILNNLRRPYLVETQEEKAANPGTLRTGDTILIGDL